MLLAIYILYTLYINIYIIYDLFYILIYIAFARHVNINNFENITLGNIPTEQTVYDYTTLILWATKKVTFFENWLLFLIGQYFMYVLGNEK